MSRERQSEYFDKIVEDVIHRLDQRQTTDSQEIIDGIQYGIKFAAESLATRGTDEARKG